MSLTVKPLHGGGLQVDDTTGHWAIFSLDELRSRLLTVGTERVEGPADLPPEKADLFVWAAFAAARGFAVEHGLIQDDRPTTQARR